MPSRCSRLDRTIRNWPRAHRPPISCTGMAASPISPRRRSPTPWWEPLPPRAASQPRCLFTSFRSKWCMARQTVITPSIPRTMCSVTARPWSTTSLRRPSLTQASTSRRAAPTSEPPSTSTPSSAVTSGSTFTFTGYHVLLGKPVVLAERSITVPKSLGGVFSNPFGTGVIGTYDINAFDAKLQSYMTYFTQINPGVLPLFITYDIFLTSGTCCIGGYHNANGAQPGGQTYSHATYVDSPGSFSQDVSALSHEIGEWMDDPFADNFVHCNDNSLMEDGDPLENNSNYGTFPYSLGGFTYHLQSLVFFDYFGAQKATSVHGWYSFQHDMSHVCPGQ